MPGTERMMCPHCGGLYRTRHGLIRGHEYDGTVCPGSDQNPRCAESDARPLWNGEPNLRFAGSP